MIKKFTSSFWITVLLIITASLVRIISNELNLWNFSPVAAIALFAGVRFTDKKFAFVIPISIMLLTDLVIGFNTYMFPVYFSLCLTTLLGIMIAKKENIISVTAASLVGSAIFFIITNLVFWYDTSLYPHSFTGQMESFI